MFKRFLTLLGIGEHAEFIWACLNWLGLTKPINWLGYAFGSGMSGYLADAANWSPIWVFLAVIGVGAVLCLAYGIIHWVRLHPVGAVSKGKVEAPVLDGVDDWRPIFEALAYVARRTGDTDTTEYLPKARLDLRQRALDKKIVIRGRKSAKLMGGGLIWSEVETEIINTYWEVADLHITATAADAEDSPQTFPHRFSSGLFGDSQIYLYTKLRVNWPDILKEWPSC
jgi:hypothetical protein